MGGSPAAPRVAPPIDPGLPDAKQVAAWIHVRNVKLGPQHPDAALNAACASGTYDGFARLRGGLYLIEPFRLPRGRKFVRSTHLRKGSRPPKRKPSFPGGDTERFHFAVEVAALEAQDFGGAADVAVVFFESAEDIV